MDLCDTFFDDAPDRTLSAYQASQSGCKKPRQTVLRIVVSQARIVRKSELFSFLTSKRITAQNSKPRHSYRAIDHKKAAHTKHGTKHSLASTLKTFKALPPPPIENIRP